MRYSNTFTNSLLAITCLISTLLSQSNINIEGRKLLPKRKYCQCGIKGPGDGVRIIGGSEATIGEYPWMAALLRKKSHICGATLINEKFLLTAAHCVQRYSASELKVRLLEHYLWTPDETNSVTRNVESYLMHPNYNTETHDNDIALLQLENIVNLHREGAPVPICLPKLNYEHKNVSSVITGWGLVSLQGTFPIALQHAGVTILSRKKCLKVSKYNRKRITRNMLCARAKGKDTCSGDSGGPIITQREADGQYEIAGITSWGVSCALWKYPGIYTKVSRYINWIKTNARSGKYCPEN